jgi:ADP-heptose:LPS heptosyltransferase
VEQNRRAIALALGGRPGDARADVVKESDRAAADRVLGEHGITRRPWVAIHPSGGRSIKQWPPARWAAVAGRLSAQFGGTLLITGSAADAALAAEVAQGLDPKPVDLTGRLSVREMLGLLSRLDLFLSPDTGPMHMACAVGTPSVSVFGPSDSVRYFSGGTGQSGTRHVVARQELWCAPCNLIRKPPAECASLPTPECLDRVSVDDVVREAARLLRETGGFAAATS